MKAVVHRAFNKASQDVLKYLKKNTHFKLAKEAEDEDDLEEMIAALPLEAIAGITSVESDLSDVAGDSGEKMLLQIDIPGVTDLFGQVNDRALTYARDRAAELVSGLDDATRSMLASTIAEGIEANRGLDYISNLIQESYAFSEERANLIAQTEVAMANGAGVLDGMKLAREKGVKLKKVWLPDELACDECLANGEQGPIDLDDDFQSGDDAPPAHPNCRCDMASEVEEEEESDDNAGDQGDED